MKRFIKNVLLWAIAFAIAILISSFFDKAVATAYAPTKLPCDQIEDIQLYARCEVEKHWDLSQWEFFNNIVSQESRNWEVTTAHYPTGYTADGIRSTAHGLGGFLDSTWALVGCEKSDDPFVQVDCTIKYIDVVYQTPKIAWDHHLDENYY